MGGKLQKKKKIIFFQTIIYQIIVKKSLFLMSGNYILPNHFFNIENLEKNTNEKTFFLSILFA